MKITIGNGPIKIQVLSNNSEADLMAIKSVLSVFDNDIGAGPKHSDRSKLAPVGREQPFFPYVQQHAELNQYGAPA